MTEQQQKPGELLNGFIKLSQYLIGLPSDADIYQEVPRALSTFFSADISFVTGYHRQKVMGYSCFGMEEEQCKYAAECSRQIIDEVLRNGFLASETVDFPERHGMAFLPVSHDNQVVAVLAVGHRRSTTLSREELDVYLGVAGLVETIVAKQISEKRFQHMADNVPEMLFRLAVHPDGGKKFEYVSKGAFHVLGCAPETLTASPSLFFSNFLEQDGVLLDQHISKAVDKEQRFMHTVRWRSPEGTLKYIEVNARASQEEDGTIHLDAVAEDVTVRQLAEEQICKARDEWERTFDAIGDIITLQDKNMRIVRANKAACKALGASQEKLIGKHCYELFSNKTIPCPHCPATESLEDGKFHFAEIRHKQANLNTIFQVSISPLKDETGGLAGIVHVAKDISEQKNLELQLRQAQKMSAIGTLAGGIAHDFNNLLTPILGYTDLLLLQLEAGSSQSNYIKEISRAGNRAKDLVKQILTFSRQAEQEPVPLHLQSIAKEVIKLLRSSIPSTIDIKQDVDWECPAVKADPTQIHQVIMNLCTNAYHAMRNSGGTLTVDLKKVEIGVEDLHVQLDLVPGVYARLEVSDTGHGMSHETMERIFEPYYTTKEIGDGTGLGLAVVHGIISSCGGIVSVDSEPDKGSIFHVYLPCIRNGVEKVEDAEDALPKGSAHVLVVDDSGAIVQLEETMLESLGYRATSCTSPEKALEMFQTDPNDFDLLLTDMTMPGMTGIQLARRVLAMRPEMPIILCTGFSEIINEKQAKAYGVGAYIMKPIIRKDLANALHDLLEKVE